MAMSSSSSEDESELELIVLNVPEINCPAPITATVISEPQPVYAENGATIFFRSVFRASSTKSLYTVWTVGNQTITRTMGVFDILSNNGEFVLFIHHARFYMTGPVTCKLYQKMHVDSRLLCTLTTFCRIIPYYEIIKEFRICKNWFQGHLQKMDLTCWVYGEMNVDNKPTSIAVSQWHLAPPYQEVMPRRRSRRQVREMEVIRYNMCNLHTRIYITYARFSDYNLYACASNDKDEVTKLTVQMYQNQDNMYEVKLEWEKSECNCHYMVERECSRGLYNLILITEFNCATIFVAAPPVYINIRVRNFTPSRQRSEFHDLKNIKQELPNPVAYFVYKPVFLLNIFFNSMSPIISSSEYCSFRVLSENGSNQKVFGKFMDTSTTALKKSATKEFTILQNLSHANIVTLLDGFRAPTLLIIVEEYLWGGSLCSVLAEEKVLPENIVRVYLQQILSAVKYLHKNDIAHLNLTLSNILFTSYHSNVLKITNFRKARYVNTEADPMDFNSSSLHCQSIYYMAPEILCHEPIAVSADMWSVGIITYLLLTGEFPIKQHEDLFEYSRVILGGNYTFEETEYNWLSMDMKAFINNLIVRNPDKRFTADLALETVRFKGCTLHLPEETQYNTFARRQYCDHVTRIFATRMSVFGYHIRNIFRSIWIFIVGKSYPEEEIV